MRPLYLLSFIFASLASPAFARPPTTCPDLTQGETPEDCPWGAIGRELHTTPLLPGAVLKLLQAKSPGLFRQIKLDSAHAPLIGLWGQSLNYDEYMKAEIVAPWIMDGLVSFMGYPERNERIVHAGVEHTYGYLFSILKTSFGYKRARWVLPDIELGFGLPRGSLGPLTQEGTLLRNVTAFFGRLAIRQDAAALGLLKAVEKQSHTAIQNYDYASLKSTRLIETVSLLATESSPLATVTLETTLIPFSRTVVGTKNQALLIYTVKDSRLKQTQLISGFPVESSFITNYLDPKKLGADQLIQTRFNAYVPGITNSPDLLRGTRIVTPQD